MDAKLKQYVIDSFSSENSLAKYKNDVNLGLWESEEILIKKYFQPNSTILDLGCGAGRTSFPLAKLGYKVTGVDVTPVFIDAAKLLANQKNITIEFSEGDACKLNYNDNNFDNILFSFNGWSMIPTKSARLEAAKEIYRVLKPNGHFMFTFHKRTIVGQELMWFIQLIKLYLLKPLGLKTKEIDFGDFYFNRDSETTYPIEQFVSFLAPKEVKNIFENIGFEVEFAKMRSEISKRDSSLKSGDVMFFVCKKK